MSKNLTRKSVAFGALIALGTTLIAGAPAHAANISIAPSAGTGNTTILGESFVVQSTLDALVPESSFDNVKFKVTNDSGATLTYVIVNGSAATENVDGAAGATSTGTSDVVSASGSTTVASTSTLGISAAGTTATTVSVVAFIDSDNGDDLDAGEYQTAPYEVKFVKAADAGLTVAWTGALGDATVTGTVTSSVVNVAQIAAGAVTVKFGKYISGVKKALTAAVGSGDTYTTGAAGNTVVAAIVTDNVRRVTAATDINNTVETTNALTNGSFLAQAVYVSGGVYTNAGPELAYAVATAEADAAESEYEIVPSADATSAGVVRKSFKGNVAYQVTVADEDGKVLAGKNVRLSTGDITGTFTVNGVAAADSSTYDAVTNASGVATFNVASSTALTTDSFVVSTIIADGASLASGTITDLTYATAAYTVYEKNAAFTVAHRGVVGSSATLTYVVLDQWKQPLTGASYRMHATLSGSSVAVLTDTLADGSATFAITDGGLDTTGKATVVTSKFQELVSGSWQDAGSVVADPTDPAALTFNWIAAQTDKITFDGITSTGAQASTGNSQLSASITRTKTVAVDTALANTPEVFAPGTPANDAVTIVGDISNAATGAAKKGAQVTISGDSSILFNVGTTWALGSLTFYATDAGAFSVNAYSNKAQVDTVVTVTSNGVSKTAKVTFVGTADASHVVAINTTAPAYLAPGRSAAFTFTAVDKYGNAVLLAEGGTDDDVTITQTGAGYLTSTPLVFTKGVASLVLITQPNDTGSAVLKAVAVLGGSDDITKSATITIGSAPVAGATAAIAGSTKRMFVSVTGNTTAKNVVVKVAGKTVATLKGSKAKKTYTIRATKGSKKVTVYVGGKLIATKTVTVK